VRLVAEGPHRGAYQAGMKLTLSHKPAPMLERKAMLKIYVSKATELVHTYITWLMRTYNPANYLLITNSC